MKYLSSATVLCALTLGAPAIPAAAPLADGTFSPIVEHGGGCRKSSPPGQCCHMDRRSGSVHCH